MDCRFPKFENDLLEDYNSSSEVNNHVIENSNNLTFYPKRQPLSSSTNGLTRSIGTLVLSLDHGKTDRVQSLKGIEFSKSKHERNNSIDDVHDIIYSWSPFNDNTNQDKIDNITLKRTASKYDLSPLNSGERIQKRVLDPNKKPKKIESINCSFNQAKPNQIAFESSGLISKQNINFLPNKLIIPDTPIKKLPSLQHKNVTDDSSIIDSHIYLTTNMTTLSDSSTSNSPLVKQPSISSNEASPLSGFNHFTKFKKKSSRRIMKNIELSNTLQEFTDELYGNDKGDLFLKSSDNLIKTPTKNQSLKAHPRSINATIKNPDDHILTKFTNVSVIGKGQFSKVYKVTYPETQVKFAIKSIRLKKHNSTKRILQEISILSTITNTTDDAEGKEYIIYFISSWKHHGSFYLMTEYCENGNLDNFLREQAKQSRLEDWRIWKILVELCLGLRFIHDSCNIVHLDLKPANILITFEGNLKLADFGMATKLPILDRSFENEGDREYIAPEIISDGIYDFKADIFSLGLIIVEIAANVMLPDNGNAWHKLRSGDLSDAGKLSSTEIHSKSLLSAPTIDTAYTNLSDFSLEMKPKIPAWVPKFLIDGESLERIVKWMIQPDLNKRPTANLILHTEECEYVEHTRKTGAIIQEDDFGPRPRIFT